MIGDAEKRKKYDELGADWERGTSQDEIFRQYSGPRGGGAEAAGGFSDFFERFFAGGGFSMSGGRGRAVPISRISISAPVAAEPPCAPLTSRRK